MVHQVPILPDAGVARQSAALLASLTGIAGMIGKLATDWLMDRFRPDGLAVPRSPQQRLDSCFSLSLFEPRL
jgi:hypothetical protein